MRTRIENNKEQVVDEQ